MRNIYKTLEDIYNITKYSENTLIIFYQYHSLSKYAASRKNIFVKPSEFMNHFLIYYSN